MMIADVNSIDVGDVVAEFLAHPDMFEELDDRFEHQYTFAA